MENRDAAGNTVVSKRVSASCGSATSPIELKRITAGANPRDCGRATKSVGKTFLPTDSRRRDGRVAEGARLESVFTRKGNVGSNPTLSASLLIIDDLSE